MDKSEIPLFLQYVDHESKGFLNFTDFSKKIRPNMIGIDEKGNTQTVTNILPSYEVIEQQKKDLPNVTKKYE